MIKNIKLSLITILFYLSFISCSSTPPLGNRGYGFTPKTISTTYQASYEYTWKVTLYEVQRYQLNIVNKEAGTIITKPVSKISDKHEDKVVEYIDIKLTALNPINSIPQTKVEITKFSRTDPYIGRPKPVKSDLVEEKIIHHRIKRLLEIERKKLERNLN